MPETSLARELDMAYASIAVVVNFAAGCGDNQSGISIEAVNATAKLAMGRVGTILERVCIEEVCDVS